MHLSHRPTNFRQPFNRSHFRTFVIIATVCTFFLTPLAAYAQGPNTFWIPPYRLQEVPPVADAASVASATVDESLRLIVDTDPGVDDAVALAWLLSTLDDDQILGIVTVAGNTTVENATANANTVLSLVPDPDGPEMGAPDVAIIEGAKKPLSQKLSSTSKLIHGPDGLWGFQLAQTAKGRPKDIKDARTFYCSTAKTNPGATILALGPLTNLAEAIRRCHKDMLDYERIVILGGAKFGGNTTPVAEFNFWQDPEAAQIVLGAGIPIDLVPMDTFIQLEFPLLDLTGFDFMGTGGVFDIPAPTVFNHLKTPVAFYAGVQYQSGVLEPSIPDLTAAIYAVRGGEVLLQSVSPAVVEVVDKPDSVRGQSIIGLGRVEQLTMLSSDRELDAIAEGAFIYGQDWVNDEVDAILSRAPLHIKVITGVDGATMSTLFLDDLGVSAAALDAQPKADEQVSGPDTIYLPSITTK